MAHDQALTERVRQQLAGIRNVVEKRMFGGVAFMVNGKLCVTVGRSRVMCRIDPAIQEELTRRRGCRPVTMKGRVYKGYVRVDEKVLAGGDELAYWIGLALDFNKRAKAATRR